MAHNTETSSVVLALQGVGKLGLQEHDMCLMFQHHPHEGSLLWLLTLNHQHKIAMLSPERRVYSKTSIFECLSALLQKAV